MPTLDGEVDMASYAARLKALHADVNLFNHVKFFICDLYKYLLGDGGVELRLMQDPYARFYMNSVYFTPKQVDILTSFKGRDGRTLGEALQSARVRRSEVARTFCTSGYEVWTISDLAPEMEDLFGVKKHFDAEHGFKLLFDKFVKKRLD